MEQIKWGIVRLEDGSTKFSTNIPHYIYSKKTEMLGEAIDPSTPCHLSLRQTVAELSKVVNTVHSIFLYNVILMGQQIKIQYLTSFCPKIHKI